MIRKCHRGQARSHRIYSVLVGAGLPAMRPSYSKRFPRLTPEVESALNNPQLIRLFRQNPLGNHVVVFPVRFLQSVDAHRLAATWRVDEAVVAQVNGNVIDPTALDIEENQVARLQVVAIDFLPMTAGHGVGGARQVERGVVERVFHQAAAIEAFAWAAAAPTIGSAQDVYSAAQYVAAVLGAHRWNQAAFVAGQGRSMFSVFFVFARRSRNVGF